MPMRRLALLLTCCILAPACGGSGGGGGGGVVLPVSTSPTYAVSGMSGPTAPSGIATADFNGDGKPDFAVISFTAFTVTVFKSTSSKGNLAGTFGTPFATGTNPVFIIAADLNLDGRPDLVVANLNSNSISVYLNTTPPGGTPSFSAKTDFSTGLNPAAIVAADFNHDGKIDLAVVNSGAGTISVFLNTAAPGAAVPSFTAKADFNVGTTPMSVTTADVQNDGLPDLIVANSGSNTVSVLLNTTAVGAAAPTFSAASSFATGTSPSSVVALNLEGDGLPDLAVANNGSNTVSILRNTTAIGAVTTSFAPRVDFSVGPAPAFIATGNFKSGGFPDLVVSDSGGSALTLLLNHTGPGFATPAFTRVDQALSTSGPGTFVVGDFDLDGAADFIVAFQAAGNLESALSQVLPPTIAPDFIETFLTGAVVAPVLADFNGDGKPDIAAISGTSNLGIFLNTTPIGGTTPSFAAPALFAGASATLTSIAVADFNLDGKPDVAVTNFNMNHVSVFLNTTAPGSSIVTFAARIDFPVQNAPQFVAAKDMNGDGRPDLVVANSGSASISGLLNTTPVGGTTVSFAARVDFPVGANPVAVALDDLNGDGMPDIVVANYFGGSITVYIGNNPPGSTPFVLGSRTDFPVGLNPSSVAIADLNGDGRPDIAVANLGSRTVTTLVNTAAVGAVTPEFLIRTDFSGVQDPVSLAVRDLNGDGKPDIVTCDSTATVISVYLNVTPPAGPAVELELPTHWGQANSGNAVAIGDLNGDGKPDLVISSHLTTFEVLLQK